MTTQTEALKLALEALEVVNRIDLRQVNEVIAAIKEALANHIEDNLAMVAQPEQEPVAWRPDVCPITGRPFFMWIEHHKTGQMVPTYGGPYDSYTIPVRDDDGSYCRERYDHDNGWWVTNEVEDVGVQIVSDQAYVSDDEPPQRKPLEEYEIEQCVNEADFAQDHIQSTRWVVDFARAIEAAHGIKE